MHYLKTSKQMICEAYVRASTGAGMVGKAADYVNSHSQEDGLCHPADRRSPRRTRVCYVFF